MVWNLISIQNKKHAKFVHVIVSTIYKESDRILKDIEETIALYAARFNIKKIIQCIIKYTGGLYLCIYRKPVLSACRSGNIEILKMLSEQGSDLHFNDCEPFREAIKNGHIDIARYLLSLGSDVHAHNDYAYRIAAKKKDKNLQDFLKTIL
jgi:ankyrin repeat protein